MKAVSIILAVALCIFVIIPSFAENNEILFRGIPWCCHPDAFEANLGIKLFSPNTLFMFSSFTSTVYGQ